MVRRKNVYSVLHFILNCNTQCVHAQSTVILYFTVEKKAKVCFKENFRLNVGLFNDTYKKTKF